MHRSADVAKFDALSLRLSQIKSYSCTIPIVFIGLPASWKKHHYSLFMWTSALCCNVWAVYANPSVALIQGLLKRHTAYCSCCMKNTSCNMHDSSHMFTTAGPSISHNLTSMSKAYVCPHADPKADTLSSITCRIIVKCALHLN